MSLLNSKKNSDVYFDNTDATKNLKERTIKGGILTLSSQAIKFILQLGSTVFLARLLTPEDYGIVGMVTVVLGFLTLFKDVGLSQATVQSSEINQAQVSNLFWVNVSISFIISFLIFILAPRIVSFYQEPRLLLITRVLAVSFFISGLSLQHLALLRRQMLFEKIVFVEMGSQFVGLTVGIISAVNGLGYWSLVLMQVIPQFVILGGVLFNCRWIPSLPSRNSGVREMLNYGWNLTGFTVLNFFSRNLDNVLIGRYWGSEALGLYSKAYQLLLLPLSQINAPIANVALPALSKLQYEPERYERFYNKILLLISTLGMPVVSFFFIDADKLILLLLGKDWLEIVPIFKALVPASFVGTLNISVGLVFKSLGKARQLLVVAIVSSFLDVTVFIITVQYGVMVLAIWFSIFSVIKLIPTYWYCYQGTSLTVKKTLKVLIYPLTASLIPIYLLTFRKYLGFYPSDQLFSLFADVVLYLLLYFLVWVSMPRGFKILDSLFHDFFISKR